MSLLVATQNPNATAETYVRGHMRSIAPDRTVGLAFTMDGSPPLDIPFFSVVQPNSSLWREIFLWRGRKLHGFAGAPVGRQREAVLSFFRKHDVSLVLAEFGPTGAALRTICKSAGIPLVVNFHGYDATVMPKRPDICAAYRLLARDVAGVLCGSRHFRDTVASIGFSKDQITVIPCGVNTEQFSANPARSGRRLVAVGRLTPKKAPLVTLKAFQKARQSFPDLTLTVIGDGPLMPDCRAFVAESCLSGCVILHGATSHAFVQETLSDADIFIQHSITAPNGDTESQGISLIEAMASHLPVVTTDHNGFSETVLDGQTGFLVPEGDEDAMAERIVRLLKDIQMRKTFGEAGYVRAKTFFDDRIVTQRLRDYLKTISSF